jgi:hypothetical protein
MWSVQPVSSVVEAWRRLRDTPFYLQSLWSWLLFVLGVAISGSAMWKGYALDDPYPGYGGVARRRRKAVDAYNEERRALIDNATAIADKYSDKARRAIESLGRQVHSDSMSKRIDLYVLAGDGTQALVPKVSMCRPPSEGNAMTENPARIREHYIDGFKKPLEDALAPMMAPAASPSSPIMESVKAVCVAAFGNLANGAIAQMTIAPT